MGLSNDLKSEKSSKPVKAKDLQKIVSKDKDVAHSEEDNEMHIFQPVEQIIVTDFSMIERIFEDLRMR